MQINKGGVIMKGNGTCCPNWFSWLILIAGVLYLLQDLGMSLGFWRFEWYTVLFVLWGLAAITGNK